MKHKTFAYQTLDCVQKKAGELNAYVPLSEDLSVLSTPLSIPGHELKNRFVIQPMEGCDGTAEGAPDELVIRRYLRFAAAGAGLIWFEAVGICPEGRANPRQLMLTAENLDVFKKLLHDIRETAQKTHGFVPPIIMQATHSGRYSRPGQTPAPRIALHIPPYEKDKPLSDETIVSDDYLDSLAEKYAESARLAQAAGFDGMDIKACHGYLLCELLSARMRENSRHGGSFENRTRLFFDAIRAAWAATSAGLLLSTRINAYDGLPYPYGFGVSADGDICPDMTEPLLLLGQLEKLGLTLINITMGNPYVNPHVNRPFDKGFYTPSEHPLDGLGRMYLCTKAIKDAYPGMTIIASALSYLRQFSPHVAAGLVTAGAADLVGYGREAFAYPGFIQDILNNGAMDKAKCCISCGKCSELMRAGSTAGCVIRDGIYAEIYKRDVVKQ